MKTPKSWRLIVVDEQPYLWTVRAKKIECARALRVHVRRAEVVDGVVVSHAYVGAMETTIAAPSHCGGPQCRQLDPPRAITPGEVADWVRGEVKPPLGAARTPTSAAVTSTEP